MKADSLILQSFAGVELIVIAVLMLCYAETDRQPLGGRVLLVVLALILGAVGIALIMIALAYALGMDPSTL